MAKRTNKPTRKAIFQLGARYIRGATIAAAYADDYNATTTHGHTLGSCILAKMNIISGKPKVNRKRISVHDIETRAIGLALATVAALGCSSANIQNAADSMGITISQLRRVKLAPIDLKWLKRAGLK